MLAKKIKQRTISHKISIGKRRIWPCDEGLIQKEQKDLCNEGNAQNSVIFYEYYRIITKKSIQSVLNER